MKITEENYEQGRGKREGRCEGSYHKAVPAAVFCLYGPCELVSVMVTRTV